MSGRPKIDSNNRKTLWSRRRKEAGLCFCGKPTNGRSLCKDHLEIQKQRMRRRPGFNGQMGREKSISAIESRKIPHPDAVKSRKTDNEYYSRLRPLFADTFANHIKFPHDTSCWEWGGQVIPNRRYPQHKYGFHTWAIRTERGWKTVGKAAHRIAWEAIHGPIPEGRELDHLCENKLCVNPEHLELVTRQENVVRGFMRRQMEAAS